MRDIQDVARKIVYRCSLALSGALQFFHCALDIRDRTARTYEIRLDRFRDVETVFESRQAEQ